MVVTAGNHGRYLFLKVYLSFVLGYDGTVWILVPSIVDNSVFSPESAPIWNLESGICFVEKRQISDSRFRVSESDA